MDRIIDTLQNSVRTSDPTYLHALLIAFIVGQANAWVYMWTHRGVSYSRSFTQSLLLITLVSALSMSLVSTNVVVAFGLVGGLAIIRFRTVVRDARDTTYVLLCLVCGLAAGFGYFSVAIGGSLVANAAAFYLAKTQFGSLHSIDSLLRFHANLSVVKSDALAALLRTYCRRHELISVDEALAHGPDESDLCQCAYKIRLRDPNTGNELVGILKDAFSVRAVHLLVQRENEEVA